MSKPLDEHRIDHGVRLYVIPLDGWLADHIAAHILANKRGLHLALLDSQWELGDCRFVDYHHVLQ